MDVRTTLLDLWAGLGLDVRGVDDDVFERGADSLTVIRFLSRMRDTLGVELPLAAVCEAPTVAMQDEAFSRQARLPQAGASPSDAAAAPLSFVQQHHWRLNSLLGPGAPSGTAAMLRIRGRLDPAALELALNEVVRRHHALRTSFRLVDGAPVQVVEDHAGIVLGPVRDLASGPNDRTADLAGLAADAARRPFDVAGPPLFRAVPFRLAADDHALVLAGHRLVTDQGSWHVVARDLLTACAAAMAGRPTALPEAPARYADIARRQGRLWDEGRFADQLSRWRLALRDAPPSLTLPADRPRPPVQSYRGGTHRVPLPAGAVGRLRSLGREEGATLFMALLAVLAGLLHRYTGQDDIVVGFPIDGRSRTEWEDVVGPFTHELPLRTPVGRRETPRELIRRVRTAALAAYSAPDLPIERLVAELGASAGPGQLQAGLAMDLPAADLRVPGLLARLEPVDLGVVGHDLLLRASPGPGGDLALGVEYRTDLFDDETAARTAGHVARLLEAMAQEPDRPLSELGLLGRDERSFLLEGLNRTEQEYPRTPYAHQLVEEQARSRPDAEAVAFEGVGLTYAELDARANRLARRLRRFGVGPEVLVAICLERSTEMVTALLAVLKAGGAYVPIDPRYPSERMAYMLEDTRARVLLTHERLLAGFPRTDTEILCLDRDWPAIEGESAEAIESGVTGRNLAYVVYTSGSTGRPKGVQVDHEALLNMVYWDRRSFDITDGDRCSQVAGLAFDASVWEIWPCLTAGAALVVADEETRISPHRLREWLVEHRITHAWSSTPLAEGLMALDPPAGLRVRTLLIGGDQLHRPARPQPYRVINNYGPAEYTVVTTFGEVDSGAADGTMPSIGRALPNTQLYVLDEHLAPVPRGIAGELYIAGDGLARGYLDRPGLTAEKFLPNPYGAPGSRFYRTGDLTRYRPDGELDFLGRLDTQVKLRGVRIELGEIEAILRRHPGVQEAVVIVREDSAGVKRLVAYVSSGSVDVSPDDLRGFLRRELPDYVIPESIMVLATLPITTNGKVDRAALPDPEAARPRAATTAPAGATEAAIVEVWERVLCRPVGTEDDFFELGGHSLLATQVIASLQERFGVNVPLRRFFAAPTVQGLARLVDELKQPASPAGRERS
jgi:amino acid adenylation domain-containing protein